MVHIILLNGSHGLFHPNSNHRHPKAVSYFLSAISYLQTNLMIP